MGSAGSATPRVVLHTAPQKALGEKRTKDAEKMILQWYEDASPLALSLKAFQQVLGDNGDLADMTFKTFDTDCNQKVDIFEVISAAVLLSQGDLQDKVEMLLPVFDFSGLGSLTFDEVQILLHGVCRGVGKVCGLPATSDEDLVQVCRQIFDAHNLHYLKTVSRDQVKRWLRNDIEASQFLAAIQNAVRLSEVRAEMLKREQSQAACFSDLEAGSGTVQLEALLRSDSLQKSLESPPDKVFKSCIEEIAKNQSSGHVGSASVTSQRFREAMRAWNAFAVLDSNNSTALPSKELRNLLWLVQDPDQPGPTVEYAREKLQDLKLTLGKDITLLEWLKFALSQRG